MKKSSLSKTIPAVLILSSLAGARCAHAEPSVVSTLNFPLPLEVEYVKYSPSGRLLAVGGHDGATVVMEVATGRKIFEATMGPDKYQLGISLLDFSLDETALLEMGGFPLLIWDLSTGKERGETAKKPLLGTAYVAVSPVNQTLLEGTFEGTFYMDDLRTGATLWSTTANPPVHMPDGTYEFTAEPHFSPDGAYILAALEGYANNMAASGVGVWRAQDGKELFQMRGPLKHVAAITTIQNSTWVAATSQDNRISIWDYTTGQSVAVLKNTDRAPGLATDDVGMVIGVSKDGKRIATGSLGGLIAVWDIASKTKVAEWYDPGPDGGYSAISRIEFTADGSQILTTNDPGQAKLWAAYTGELRLKIDSDHPILSNRTRVDLSPDGHYLAVGSRDLKNVRIFDIWTQP